MISREWTTYAVKAVFAERETEPWPHLPAETISNHTAEKKPGFSAWIGRLPVSIVSETANIFDVVQTTFGGKLLRVYPPFPIDIKGETSGALAQSWIPEGLQKIDRHVAISQTATLGTSVTQTIGPGTFFCEGIRLDVETGVDFKKFVALLLENIGQHTHQWWLRGRTQPFRGMGRLGCELNSDYTLRDILKFHGAGQLESPWYGLTETQRLIGFERPLTNSLWIRCCHDAAKGMRGDSGILSFHDAVSYYMAGDEVLCIMSLSITVEILGNKRRILKHKKPTGFAELLKTTDLVDSTNKAVLQRLFVDRGHVAHGRDPHHVGGKSDQKIEEYIEAVQQLVSQYLHLLEPHEWPLASQLRIDRGRGGT